MKKFLILILAGGFATAAAAQQPASDTAQPQAENATAIGADSSDVLADRNCLRHTGSRITASRNATRLRRHDDKTPPECANAPGRSYTGEDLQNTGQTNVADALRMLDPSVH